MSRGHKNLISIQNLSSIRQPRTEGGSRTNTRPDAVDASDQNVVPVNKKENKKEQKIKKNVVPAVLGRVVGAVVPVHAPVAREFRGDAGGARAGGGRDEH